MIIKELPSDVLEMLQEEINWIDIVNKVKLHFNLTNTQLSFYLGISALTLKNYLIGLNFPRSNVAYKLTRLYVISITEQS